jgi:hypothetical protein
MGTLLDEITGNANRSQALLVIVREALAEGDATLEKVQAKTDRFGPTFGEVQPDEYAIAVSMLSDQEPASRDASQDATAVPDGGQEPPSDAKSDGGDQDATGVPDAAPEPASDAKSDAAPNDVAASNIIGEQVDEMTRDQANAAFMALQNALHSARQERMQAESDQRAAREAMSQAIMEWSAGGPTAAQIRQNELAAISRDRQAKPSRRERHIADSYFDRVGAFGRGDATSFARQSHPVHASGSGPQPMPGPHPFRGGQRHARGDVFVRKPDGTGGIMRVPPSERGSSRGNAS